MKEGTYRFGVERGMQRSFTVLALMLAMLWTVTLVSAAGTLDGGTATAGWLFVVVLLGSAVRAWRCRLAAPDAWAASAAALVVYVAIGVSRPEAIVVGTRGNPALVAGILAAGFLPPRRAWPACVTVCLGQVIASLPSDGPVGALESLWPAVSGTLAAGVLSGVMRSAAARADHAHDALLAAQANEAHHEGLRSAHRTFQRMLHDDVAAALQAVAGRGVTRAEVRRSCADALAAISRAPAAPVGGTRNLAGDVEDLRTVIAVTTTVHIDGDVLVPAAVASAMLAAAREALRNVDRHAFADAVSVRLEEGPHGVTLTVADNGVGFSPTRARGRSWGLNGSVVERMAEVGGTAEVVSEKDAGTSVRLGWSRAAALSQVEMARPDRVGLIALAVGDIRRPLAAVCVPYLLSMYVIAVIHSDAAEGADRLTLWYTGVVLVTLALIVRAHRPVPGRVGVLAAAFAVTGLVYGLSVIPADSLDDFGSWPIGAISPLFVVLLTVRSVREAVIPLVAEEIAVLALIATGDLEAASPGAVLPALLAPVFGVVMVWVIVRTVLRLGAVVSDAHREQLAITVAEAAQQAHVTLHQRRLSEIGAELLPFLRAVGADREPPSGQEARERARALETMARDELHLPGVIDAEIRGLLSTARQAGCVVTFQSDTDSVDPPPVLRDLLAAALRGSVTPRELTLSLHPGADRVEVSLVTVPGDSSRSAEIGRSLAAFGPVVDDFPEATCVHLVVHRNGHHVPGSGDMTPGPIPVTLEGRSRA
ncbi:sensor histidine kinase [Streptomyces sp. NPDC057939]|uniref:sensor histidine kinase n=1 Tax=Streptomyces sp. NPDC057939 TaxID=3346284 RepID=UPI0036F0DF5A